MATLADPPGARPVRLTPGPFEYLLATVATILLAMVVVALARGFDRWAGVPWQIWLHLVTVVPALALTPVMLLRRRGDPLHRLLGKIWVVAMVTTALLSLNVREINHGQFSPIHLFAIPTLIQAPLIWWAARTHRVALHRRFVLGLVTGALILAGAFTFPFGRMLGSWLFG